jgi:hypothetical protein
MGRRRCGIMPTFCLFPNGLFRAPVRRSLLTSAEAGYARLSVSRVCTFVQTLSNAPFKFSRKPDGSSASRMNRERDVKLRLSGWRFSGEFAARSF